MPRKREGSFFKIGKELVSDALNLCLDEGINSSRAFLTSHAIAHEKDLPMQKEEGGLYAWTLNALIFEMICSDSMVMPTGICNGCEYASKHNF